MGQSPMLLVKDDSCLGIGVLQKYQPHICSNFEI